MILFKVHQHHILRKRCNNPNYTVIHVPRHSFKLSMTKHQKERKIIEIDQNHNPSTTGISLSPFLKKEDKGLYITYFDHYIMKHKPP